MEVSEPPEIVLPPPDVLPFRRVSRYSLNVRVFPLIWSSTSRRDRFSCSCSSIASWSAFPLASSFSLRYSVRASLTATWLFSRAVFSSVCRLVRLSFAFCRAV